MILIIVYAFQTEVFLFAFLYFLHGVDFVVWTSEFCVLHIV